MRVAAHLQIPFLTLDASKEYKEAVIDYLLEEYKQGRTPNPDIMCNREVKFGAFYRFAVEQGADFIATGHYAQTVTDTSGTHLLMGSDETKDQSYFLWAVPTEAIARTIFPIGNLPKTQVRKLAEKYHLPNASKKDSQGICFLGTISVEDFLRKEIGSVKGVAHDEEGREIGTHDGAVLYTLGERVALQSAGAGPWYVVKKDIEKNTIVVSHTVDTTVTSLDTKKSIQLSQTNLFKDCPTPGVEQSAGLLVSAQYRYHGPNIPGTYDFATNTFAPNEPIPENVAPGQSLVLYRGNECLGGGIIN
jgi:tRNA-specific 2-thiouridylase